MKIIRLLTSAAVILIWTAGASAQATSPDRFAHNKSVTGEAYVYYATSSDYKENTELVTLLSSQTFPPPDQPFLKKFLRETNSTLVSYDEKSIGVKPKEIVLRDSSVKRLLSQHFKATAIELHDPDTILEVRGPWEISRNRDGMLSAYMNLSDKAACYIEERYSEEDKQRKELFIGSQTIGQMSYHQQIKLGPDGTIKSIRSYARYQRMSILAFDDNPLWEEIFSVYADDLPDSLRRYIPSAIAPKKRPSPPSGKRPVAIQLRQSCLSCFLYLVSFGAFAFSGV